MSDIEIAFACIAAIMVAAIMGLVFLAYDKRRITKKYTRLMDNNHRRRWWDGA
jgi:hypothetical protein